MICQKAGKRKRGVRNNGQGITKVSSLQMARKSKHRYLPQVWTPIKIFDQKWQERTDRWLQKIDEYKMMNENVDLN